MAEQEHLKLHAEGFDSPALHMSEWHRVSDDALRYVQIRSVLECPRGSRWINMTDLAPGDRCPCCGQSLKDVMEDEE